MVPGKLLSRSTNNCVLQHASVSNDLLEGNSCRSTLPQIVRSVRRQRCARRSPRSCAALASICRRKRSAGFSSGRKSRNVRLGLSRRSRRSRKLRRGLKRRPGVSPQRNCCDRFQIQMLVHGQNGMSKMRRKPMVHSGSMVMVHIGSEWFIAIGTEWSMRTSMNHHVHALAARLREDACYGERVV